jgi:fatty acid-binding protein DegV
MVKIVTDSAADLPKEIIEKYNIIVIPLNVEIDGVSYQDGV